MSAPTNCPYCGLGLMPGESRVFDCGSFIDRTGTTTQVPQCYEVEKLRARPSDLEKYMENHPV